MSTETAMALCFSLAYIVALLGVAASLMRPTPPATTQEQP